MKLSELPNIGKIVEAQLLQIGIDTPEKLHQEGSKSAWLKILQIDNSACYNRLCGLEGAIRGIRWHHLDTATKTDLKEFYSEITSRRTTH